jgi:hypothetical protein
MPKIKPRSFVRGGQLRLSINTNKPVVKKTPAGGWRKEFDNVISGFFRGVFAGLRSGCIVNLRGFIVHK